MDAHLEHDVELEQVSQWDEQDEQVPELLKKPRSHWHNPEEEEAFVVQEVQEEEEVQVAQSEGHNGHVFERES